MTYHVRDLGLALLGRQKIDWAFREMPVLREIAAPVAHIPSSPGYTGGCLSPCDC